MRRLAWNSFRGGCNSLIPSRAVRGVPGGGQCRRDGLGSEELAEFGRAAGDYAVGNGDADERQGFGEPVAVTDEDERVAVPGELLYLLCYLGQEPPCDLGRVAVVRELHHSPARRGEYREPVELACLRVHVAVGDQGDPEGPLVTHRGAPALTPGGPAGLPRHARESRASRRR